MRACLGRAQTPFTDARSKRHSVLDLCRSGSFVMNVDMTACGAATASHAAGRVADGWCQEFRENV